MFSVSLPLSVLSLRLVEECGRPYQLGSEGWRGLLAHSASNKFITPPSVKTVQDVYTFFYFHAISTIWKSAIISFSRPSGFDIVFLCRSSVYLWSFIIVISPLAKFLVMVSAWRCCLRVSFSYLHHSRLFPKCHTLNSWHCLHIQPISVTLSQVT